MKRFKVFVSILVLICTFASSFQLNTYAAAESIEGYSLVASNDRFLLYVDEVSGNIAIESRDTGYIWYSCPPDWQEDTVSGGSVKNSIPSPLTIRTINTIIGPTLTTSNSLESCQGNGGSIEVIPSENGVEFIFHFTALGIHLPVRYTLHNDYIEIKVLSSEIKEDKPDVMLLDISLFQFFSAGSSSDTGYLFVPDGTGAIINFNNGKSLLAQYKGQVFGNDHIFRQDFESFEKQFVKMPVFGSVKNDNGFAAIVTSGQAVSFINANVSGFPTGYNNVYVNFEYRRNDIVTFDPAQPNLLNDVYTSVPRNTEDYTVRFYPLTGGKASYSGMAAVYRSYLINEKGLQKRTNEADTGSELPVYLELYGAVKKTKYILGIPFVMPQPLTTFKQAKDIIDLFAKDAGRIIVRYRGWTKGGINDKIQTKVNAERRLGSNAEFRKLDEYIRQSGGELYPEINLIEIHKSGNGINRLYDAAINIVNMPVNRTLYFLNSLNPNKSKGVWRLLTLGKLGMVIQKAIKSYSGLKIDSVMLTFLGDKLYSNMRGGESDISETVKLFSKSISEFAGQIGKVMLENANEYALVYADHIVNIPLNQRQMDIIDRSVPFYQMVLHGYVNMASNPVNMESDQTNAWLKLLESGISPCFIAIGSDPEVLRDTTLTSLYSADYKLNYNTFIQKYKELNSILKPLNDKSIISHTVLTNDVSKTVYEDGTAIYVNYGDKPAKTENGAEIPSKSYYVEKGETDQ